MRIPPGWKKVKFEDIAKQKSVRVNNPGKSDFKKYVGLEHLDSGELVVKRWGSTSDVTSAMKLFNKNDILFARRNTYLRRVSVARFEGVCSGDIIVIEPILNEIIEGFLPIYMQFEQFENKVISLSAGAFSKRIKWKQLAEEEILLPTKEEQKKIVAFVWSIQDNVEKSETLIRSNEKLKRGLLNELLTKGIKHDKFKKTKIGEIPEDWHVVKFDAICKLNKGISYTSKNLTENRSDHYLINLKSFNKKGGINLRGFKLYNGDYAERFVVKPGDLVIANTDITRDAEVVGYPAIIPNYKTNKAILFTMDVSRIDIISKEVRKMYIYLFLLTEYSHSFMYSHSSGTTVLHLKTSDVPKLFVPIPSIGEQDKIIKLFSNLNSMKKDCDNSLKRLNQLKKKIIDEILKGEVNL